MESSKVRFDHPEAIILGDGTKIPYECFDSYETMLSFFLREERRKSMLRFYKQAVHSISIEHVIFSNPATIVLWSDGTKTVVKCTKNDTYSYETGIAMCMLKKIFGESYPRFKKYMKELVEKENKKNDFCKDFWSMIANAVSKEKAKELEKHVKEMNDGNKDTSEEVSTEC